MCWKCCLCLCCCSQVDDDDPVELNDRGAAKNQDKNWDMARLVQDKYYIHCSGTGPGVIIERGNGLDPSFGKEDITLKHGTEKAKYILGFPANPNVVPDSFEIPKPLQLLWSQKEIQFAYCFRWDRGKEIYAEGGYVGTSPVETGFKELVPKEVIQKVYIRTPGKHSRDVFMEHPRKDWSG